MVPLKRNTLETRGSSTAHPSPLVDPAVNRARSEAHEILAVNNQLVVNALHDNQRLNLVLIRAQARRLAACTNQGAGARIARQARHAAKVDFADLEGLITG